MQRGKQIFRNAISLVLSLLMIMAQVLPVSALGYGNLDERITWNQIDISRQFMPPNPETYPDIYTNKDIHGQKGMDYTNAALSNPGSLSSKQFSIQEASKDLVANKDLSPSVGSAEKVLVIPIGFTNVQFGVEHNTTYYQSLMNQMKDYYEQNSQYQSGVKGITINPTIVNPVTSSKTMEYYGQDSDTANGGIDDVHPVEEMAREAIQLLNARGFDFSPFDKDSDGIIDHVFIVHAGSGQEEINNSNLIWSCRSVIENGESVDGKKALNFITVPEDGAVGVYAHEFGHDLGLPDLYDTDGAMNGYTLGVGDWDLMGSGSWNYLPGDEPGTCPANLSAWCKMYLGWLTPTNISSNGTYSLTNTVGNNQAFKMWTNGNSNGDEYYLVEYRRHNGYDAGLPGEGLLIWHIDKQWINATINSNMVNSYEGRLGVELEQADGNWDLWWLVNSGDAGDPFTGTNWDEGLNNFTALPYKLNYSNINMSAFTFVEIRNINTLGSTATADYYVSTNAPTEQPVLTSPVDPSIVLTPAALSWKMANQAERYKLQIAENASFTTNLKEYYLDGSDDENLEYTGDGYIITLPSDLALAEGRKYYWRVAGINGLSAGENTVWSNIGRFTVSESGSKGSSMIITYMPTGRNGLGAVALNNKIYAVGGYTGGNNVLTTLEVYDPETDTWTTKTGMPTARESVGVVELDNTIYVIGGDTSPSGIILKTVEAYDPVTDSWTSKADLLSPKSQLAAAAVNGKIYAIGGGGSWNELEEYDPLTNTWTKKADLPYGYTGLSAAVVNGKIYVLGGLSVGVVQVYDPSLDAWSLETNAPTDMNFAGAASIGDRVYVMGGSLSTWEPNALEYDTVSKTWMVLPNLKAERFMHAVVSINDTVYLLGGRNGGTFALSTVEEYTPVPWSYLFGPQNFSEEATDNSITLTWDAENDATGYYVSVNNQEFYTTANSYTVNGLSPNKRITYKVRAVNAISTSDWSDSHTARTTGVPEISASASIMESSENGSIITIHLSNGIFRSDGIYNRSTVVLDPEQLPQGVKAGSFARINDNTLQIGLAGNRTADYDSDIYVDLTVSNRQISTGRYNNPSAAVVFQAITEIQPQAPNVTFSFDGLNAGKLMGITSAMEYSINGGNTYITAVTTDQALSLNQLNTLNAANDIRIRIKVPTGEICLIDILPGPAAPAVTMNDTSDTITGINSTMEFSTDGVNWTKYNNDLPDLTGNSTIRVRIPGTGVIAPGVSVVLTFTAASGGGGGAGGAGGGGGGGLGGIPEEEQTPSGSRPVEVEATKPSIVNGTDIAKTSITLEKVDEAVKAAEKNKEGMYELIVNIPKVSGANGYAITLPADILTTKSASADTTIQINTAVGAVILPNNMMLQDNSNQMGKAVELVLSKVNKDELPLDLKKEIGDRPVIDIHININGQSLPWNNPNAPVTISIDYTPTQSELSHPDNIVVWYIDGQGKAVSVPSGRYDPVTGKVTFTTTHFSQYAVGYYNNPLTDMNGYSWAVKEVVSMVGKGVIRGKTETTYHPGDNITRAEFLYGLIRALGLLGAAENNFEDIEITDYFYQEIAIAKQLGISNGNGSNRFGPDDPITRQDMMTLMARALKLTNKMGSQIQSADLNQFADNKLIALYAKDSIIKVVSEGIIKGDGKNINPLKNTSRAEAAVILYRIYKK